MMLMHVPITVFREQRAFTLVELLAAVAILAILVALLLPSVTKVTEGVRRAGCSNSMRQLYTALMAYRAEHNGWFPPGEQIFYSSLGSSYESTIRRGLLGESYLSEMPVCPAMRLQKTEEARSRYPDEKKRLKELGSYAINAFLLSTRMEALPGPYWTGASYPGDNKMLVLTEKTSLGAAYVWGHITSVLDGHDVGSRLTAPRDHGNLRLNWMFLDGHMEMLAPKRDTGGSYDWSEHFSRYGENGRNISPTYVPDPN